MKERVINKFGFSIRVLYEDDNVIVIDKPAGLVVYRPNSQASGPSLRDIFIDILEKSDNIRGGIVHRLDKYTSGVMIMAKSHQSLEYLQSQFSRRQVEKVYLALVWGHLKYKSAKIELPLVRSSKQPNKVVAKSGGKMSISEYQTISEFTNYTYLEVTIHTGRMHQIRAQFSHIGHQVVGDALYGNKALPTSLNRQFLHSHRLSIMLPGIQEKKTFISPLPDDLDKFIEAAK